MLSLKLHLKFVRFYSRSVTDHSNVVRKLSKLKGKPTEFESKKNLDKYWLKHLQRLPLSSIHDKNKLKIIEIKSRKECDDLLKILIKDSIKLFGFDTEGYSHRDKTVSWENWQENDKRGRRIPASKHKSGCFTRCIQLATLQGEIYFIDLFKLSDRSIDVNDMPESLMAVLENEDIQKLAWGSEYMSYEDSFRVDERSKIRFKNSVKDTQKFWFAFKPDMTYGTSLRQAVYSIFGHKIDKNMQLTDWNKLELDREQVEYACLDALATLDVGLAMKILYKEPDWMSRLNDFPKL